MSCTHKPGDKVGDGLAVVAEGLADAYGKLDGKLEAAEIQVDELRRDLKVAEQQVDEWRERFREARHRAADLGNARAQVELVAWMDSFFHGTHVPRKRSSVLAVVCGKFKPFGPTTCDLLPGHSGSCSWK